MATTMYRALTRLSHRQAPTLRTVSSSTLAHAQSSAALSRDEVRELLSKPTWSVKSLNQQPIDSSEEARITPKKLHHLLRLSALPLPSSAEEESQMIETLESQLRFVKAIQSVDTTGVRPLSCIRDETTLAEEENEITLESLADELGKEKTVGFAGRIVKENEEVDTSDVNDGDPLRLAPKTIGRYILVNTKTS